MPSTACRGLAVVARQEVPAIGHADDEADPDADIAADDWLTAANDRQMMESILT